MDSMSGPNYATSLQPPFAIDTMKAGVLAPHPDLEKMMDSQSNNLNDFDSVDPEFLLGNHNSKGIAVEGWFYFDTEDGGQAYSADLECHIRSQAGGPSKSP